MIRRIYDRLHEAYYRLRVRRALRRRAPSFAWFVVLALVAVGCGPLHSAQYRERQRQIEIITAQCIEASGNIPREQLDAYEADCVARIREVQNGH